MRLKRLTLENFRGFESLELDLSRGQTSVFVGINGAGKTSVLDAAACLLSIVAAALYAHGGIPFCRVEMSDIRIGAEAGWVRGQVELDVPDHGSELLALGSGCQHVPDKQVSSIFEHKTLTEARWYRRWFTRLHGDKPPAVPMLAFFPTERYLDADISEEPLSALPARPTALYPQTFARRVDHREFLAWYRSREDFENEQIREDRTYRDPQLEAIRRAIPVLLPGYGDLRVRRVGGLWTLDVRGGAVFTVRKKGVELRLDQLSHGEQGLLALVGDIARRLAVTQPALVDPLQGCGIVLIDEVELHLHPQWQRRIIPGLEQAFPNIQFIVTTHSPQVLSLVPREQVTILSDFKRVEHRPYTHNRDSNSILYDLMGVEAFPAEGLAQIRRVARLIDEERWDEARRALSELAEDFGPNDAEVIRLESMLAFMRDEAGR